MKFYVNSDYPNKVAYGERGRAAKAYLAKPPGVGRPKWGLAKGNAPKIGDDWKQIKPSPDLKKFVKGLGLPAEKPKAKSTKLVPVKKAKAGKPRKKRMTRAEAIAEGDVRAAKRMEQKLKGPMPPHLAEIQKLEDPEPVENAAPDAAPLGAMTAADPNLGDVAEAIADDAETAAAEDAPATMTLQEIIAEQRALAAADGLIAPDGLPSEGEEPAPEDFVVRGRNPSGEPDPVDDAVTLDEDELEDEDDELPPEVALDGVDEGRDE